MPSPTRQNLARLDMLSDSLGYAASYDGLILKYNGYDWSIYDSLNTIVQNLNEQKDSLSIAISIIGDIYTIRVKDRNNGWLSINDAEKGLFNLFSFNPKKPYYFLHNLTLKVRAMDFNNKGQGIAVGDGGAYLYDHGKWNSIILPISLDFREVRYISENKIAICGDKGVILIGSPGKWTQIENDIDVVLRDIDFISEDEGWFVGYDGVVFHYKDGHIEQELAETIENLWAVDMLSADYGFAVGTNGTILQYNGVYWDKFPFNPQVDLHDIEMINPDEGFAIGARGTILHFSEESKNLNLGSNLLFADQVHLGSDYLIDRIDDVRGITTADFNNDDLVDIYLTCYRSLNHLLLNQGKGYFLDYVIESGTGGNIETRLGKQKYEYGSLAADFDRDGDTDLLLAGKRQTTRYFVNNGKAVFSDEIDLCGLPNNLELIDGALADVNIDGYPDLILADENEGLLIFINTKYNTFSKFLELPKGVKKIGIRACKVLDLNNDHRQDVMVVFHHQHPIGLLNYGKDRWQIADTSLFVGDYSDFINSISVGDINGDGFTDLYLCSEDGNDAVLIYYKDKNHYLNESHYWNIKKGGRSYSAAIADFDMNGTNDIFVTRYGSDLLYMNRNNKFFEEKASELIYSKSGYLSGYNTGLADLDIEGNGTSDLVVGNADYWSSLLQNQIESVSSITISIEGINDTREALGAKIWLWKNQNNDTSKTFAGYYEVVPNSGLFSQNQINPIFAVDPDQNYDIQVRFLNGEEKWKYNIQAGSHIRMQQTSDLVKIFLFSGRRLLQFLHIPYIGIEILKFLIFTLIIFFSARFIEFRYHWRVSHTVFYVILLLLFYVSITYTLRDSGFIFHFLPFTIIGFVLLVLIGINEPIRISNYLQRQQQEKLKEAGLKLSRTYNDDEALQIFKESLEIIKPHKKLAIYVYNQLGNYLYRKSLEGFTDSEAPVRIMLSLDTVKMVSQDIKLLPTAQRSKIFADTKTKNLYAFNLVRKRQFLGIIILIPNDLNTSDGWEDMRYLCLQLAIALDNIRIMQNLREQEKISAIGTFAGGLIHNLKNPIDGLRMIIELLHREVPKDDSKFEYISELHNGVINLKNQLMRSFDFITNRNPLNDNIRVIPWIEQTVQRYLSMSRKIDSNYNVKEDIIIKGDREQLGFALENVIQNAIEATDSDKSIEININTIPNDQQLQIQIKDSGTGIADEHINEIFNIFYSTRGTGRGLGLTITRNIIRNHKGYIKVESELNKGSTFTIGLPLTTLEG